MERREFLLRAGLTTVAAPLIARRVVASEIDVGEVSAGEIVDLFYVQSARGASVKDGVLTLRDVNKTTIFFSDRPQRIVGHESTEDYISDWDVGEDNFAANPPNATLSIFNGPEPQEIVLVLRNPRMEADDLLYDVEVLWGKAEASGDATSLFIDTVGRPLSPVSVAGVHRRHRRRRRRHAVRSPGPI
jgi:hypothetical protein